VVTVNATPAAPTASPQSFCSADAKKVSDLVATGTTLKWYSANTGGTLYSGTELLATGTYYVSQTSASSCESARTAVVVTVNATPAAPTASPQSFCSADAKKVSDLVATGTTLKWYSANTGGTLYAGTELLATGTYYVSQTSASSCESARTAVSVTVNATPARPLLSSVTQQTCSTATGSFTITNYNASYIYIVNPSAGVTQTGNTITAPVGSYTIIAKANGCESLSSSAVIDSKICANTDNTFANQTTSGTTTVIGDVTANDTLNGQPVTAVNTNVTPIKTGPLSIDANGQLTLDANTPSGTYTITYQICEEGANPANCATNTATVVVGNTLVANIDNTFANQTTSATTTVIGDVTANDTLNGQPVTAANTNVTPIKTGPLSIDANGQLTLDANTPSGTYTITYQICEEGANPANCATNTATVVVGNTLVANIDNTFASQTTSGTTTVIGDVTANDTLNGQPVTAANTNVTPIKTGPLSIDANGQLTLDANTPSGTYTITYQICEEGASPANCATNTATVVVGNTLVANIDNTFASQTTSATTTVIGDVTANDTLNGQPVTAANTNVTPIKTGPLSIDANGELTLDPNTPSGTYTITYQICEEGASPANCATNTATVVVGNTLVANVDNTFANQTTSATTTVIGDVTANDTLNGQPVTAANTNVTPIKTGPLSIDANGQLTLDANTPSGTYTITYQICEEGANPANCATNTATVVVAKGTIIALTETTLSINGSIGGTTFSLTDNDTLNGNPVVIKNDAGGVVLTPVSVPKGLVLNPDGTVKVGAGTPIGNYEIIYTICEYLDQNNCSTVKSFIPVTAATLQANNDNAGTVDSNKGQTSTTSVFNNDTLNGVLINPSNVILSTVVFNPNLNLKSDGTIEVKPGTPSDVYELTYQICEVLNPTLNCSQAVVKISVVNSVDPNPPITPSTQIVLTNDGLINVDGINGSLEFINVLDNDLLKGSPINALDIVLSNTPKNPYFEFNPDGTVNVKPNTPGGNYSLTYQVCEKANLSNCATATLEVFVEVPAIAIIKTAVFNDENASGYANAGETITYKFKVTNTGNVPLRGVTVLDPLPGVVVSGQPIDLEVNESDENNFTATYKITQNDINKGSVSNQATAKGASDKGVVVEDKSDDENNAGDKPTVLPLNGCMIKVFNAFSPNGDQKNTRFYIQGLECYPENTVEIYNRWGVLVYDIDNYNNEDRAFKGFSEGRTTVKQADGLPVGTYFYILKYKDSASISHELSGYLYINK
jgi:gliding motility-associated-like protein